MYLKLIRLLVVIALLTSGCSTSSKVQDHTLYAGESENWFATYTISKVKASYFDSLYIQYVVDRNQKAHDSDKVGPIVYKLKGVNFELASSEPQELNGIRNFHTATEVNQEVVDMTLPDEINLEIKWEGKSERITLKK